MTQRRRRSRGRHPSAVLVLGSLCVVAGCHDAPADDVKPPPGPGRGEHCTSVADGVRVETSGGVVAGPFDNLAEAAQKTGVAKFWVASQDRPRREDDAVIRVGVAEGPVRGDPALYVRPGEDMVTVTPAPENGVDRIYNGTVLVPSAEGTTLRITVTIGEATGCFLARL